MAVPTASRTHPNAYLTAAFAVWVCAAPVAAAADDSSESPWSVGVAFGYGERSNPLIQSDDLDILLDIDIAWFGRRWFFDNGDGGRTLYDGEHVTLNAVGRIASDRVFFGRTNTEHVSLFSSTLGGRRGAGDDLPGGADGGLLDAERGDVEGIDDELGHEESVAVPDRDYALEVGLELIASGLWGYVQTSAHRDVSDRHGGYELYAHYGRAFHTRRWLIEPSFGASYKSSKLNDYYWGVRPEEATALFGDYRAGAGINSHARLVSRFQVTRNWSFVVAAQYERLNGDAARSPIVDRRSVNSVFVGLSYRL